MRKVHKKLMYDFFIKHEPFYKFAPVHIGYIENLDRTLSIFNFWGMINMMTTEREVNEIFIIKTMEIMKATSCNNYVINKFKKMYTFRLGVDYRQTRRILRIVDNHLIKHKEVVEFMSL